ncbi:hypothetical protein [Paragemmobacter straminiformis]|uniref:hypothetical protein n=1 Tax=Paragemmobacter straminiformis TaxID=2045119 RepID=UPI00163AC207|nr:hypothetical protein [Gemmobacter straminiformis]
MQDRAGKVFTRPIRASVHCPATNGVTNPQKRQKRTPKHRHDPRVHRPVPVRDAGGARGKAADVLRGLIEKIVLTPDGTDPSGHSLELF